MRTTKLIAACSAALLVALTVSAQAQSKGKACNDEWNSMKAANKTAGLKYRDFQKECMARPAAATTTAPAAPAPAAKPAAAPAAAPAAKPAAGAEPEGKPGREAMIARERACGADWKAAKAAGKIPAGQKWPQYWSECNKLKKAQGM